MNITPKIIHFSPGRILLASFIFVIAVGAILLSLPQATVTPLSLTDIIFTSTSVTCVTGLLTVPISYFTFFGKCVILCLIQIGGLGLMTLSFFLISLFLNLGMATKLMAGQILDFEFWGQVKNFLALIIGITFFMEIFGAILLYFPFSQMFDTQHAIFYAIFHSISSFCNAGVCLFDNNMANFIESPFPLIVTSGLVFAGGIGFIVWYELLRLFQKIVIKKEKVYNVSIHTKIVISVSIILIVFGALLIWGIEKDNTLKGLGTATGIINSFFISSTIRSAGFSTFAINQTSLATMLIFLVLIFIGASPTSAGGGIKVTTLAIFLAYISSIIKGKRSTEIMGRTVATDQIKKSIAIIALSIGWVIFSTFILLLMEPGFTFIQMLFEAASAFTTVGLSTGVTPFVSKYGKLLLMISMIAGRIGTLTLVLALRKGTEKDLYRYPEERMVIG